MLSTEKEKSGFFLPKYKKNIKNIPYLTTGLEKCTKDIKSQIIRFTGNNLSKLFKVDYFS